MNNLMFAEIIIDTVGMDQGRHSAARGKYDIH